MNRFCACEATTSSKSFWMLMRHCYSQTRPSILSDKRIEAQTFDARRGLFLQDVPRIHYRSTLKIPSHSSVSLAFVCDPSSISSKSAVVQFLGSATERMPPVKRIADTLRWVASNVDRACPLMTSPADGPFLAKVEHHLRHEDNRKRMGYLPKILRSLRHSRRVGPCLHVVRSAKGD